MNTESETLDVCPRCFASFKRKEWQIKRREHICLNCRKQRDKKWMDRRKSEGRPYIKPKPPQSWWTNYRKKYYSRPEVRKKEAERFQRNCKDPVKKSKMVARWTANNAIKDGKIMKMPCSKCGKENAQKHHPDYSKPLEIVWLCKSCHISLHTESAQKEGAK